jgi:hypothetical protein
MTQQDAAGIHKCCTLSWTAVSFTHNCETSNISALRDKNYTWKTFTLKVKRGDRAITGWAFIIKYSILGKKGKIGKNHISETSFNL